MTDSAGVTSENGMAIGLSVLAAGLIGSLASILISRRQSGKPSVDVQPESRLQRLELAASQSTERLAHALEAARSRDGRFEKVPQTTTRDLGKKVAEATEAAIKSANALALADKGNQMTLGVANRGSRAMASARDRSPEVIDRVVATAHSMEEQARTFKPIVQEKAELAWTNLADQTRTVSDRRHDWVDLVGPHLGDAVSSVQRHTRPLADDLSSNASHLLGQVTARVKETGRHANEERIPELQQRVDSMVKKIEAERQSASGALSSFGHEATDRIVSASSTVAHRQKTAVAAAGQGTRDATAVMLWGAAAAGVVFFAFLNDEQRARVRQSADRIIADIRDVISDVRGYDEEFGT